jgi:hypothetical protein
MKRPKPPNLVTMAILTTLTIIFWVFFTVYRAFTTQPAPELAPEILEPLSPNLDKNALDTIQTRIFFEEGQLPEIPILTPTPSPSPPVELTETPTPTPTATEGATLSPTPTATESAVLAP